MKTAVVTGTSLALCCRDLEIPEYRMQIHALDIASELVSVLRKGFEKQRWLATTALLPAYGLPFPKNTCSHSTTSFVILPFSNEEAIEICSEIYPALQIGGTGITRLQVSEALVGRCYLLGS